MTQKLTLTVTLAVIHKGDFNMADIAAALDSAQQNSQWLDTADLADVLGCDPNEYGQVRYAAQVEEVEPLYCYHGNPTPAHPDFEHRCPDCDAEEEGDLLCDLARGT